MDSVIVAEKIESLRRCVQRIEDKNPSDINGLTYNLDVAGHSGYQPYPSSTALR